MSFVSVYDLPEIYGDRVGNARCNFHPSGPRSLRVGAWLDYVQRTVDASYCLDAPDRFPAGGMGRLDSGNNREYMKTVYRRRW